MYNIGEKFTWNNWKCVITSVNEVGFKYIFADGQGIPPQYRHVNGFMMFSYRWLTRNGHKLFFDVDQLKITDLTNTKTESYGK